MNNRARFALTAWALLPLACAVPPRAVEVVPTEPVSRGPEPQSAEWLYATDGVPGGRKGECRALVPRLEAEQECKGALCSHGASLAADWLRVCKNVTPDLVASVAGRVPELRKKASAPPAACEEEVEKLLKNGCGRHDDCGKAAQGWATRCSEWSTPLAVRMLEVMVQRAGGERGRIDARSCGDLLAEVAKAGACAQQFACQDGLPAIDTYRQRCVSAEQPMTPTAAVLELAVRGATGSTAEPVATAASGKIDPALVPLTFEDGSGAVMMTCGKRAGSVDAYLGLRKSCADEDLVLARRFDGPTGPVLRVGRIAHPSDATFLLRYPSLRVEGEPKARYQALLPAFLAAVDQASKLGAEPKQTAEAARVLLGSMEKNIDAVRNSSAFEAALKERDVALIPLFSAMAAAKKKALHADLPSGKLVPALHRARTYPLADIDAEGRVRLGAVTSAGAIEIGDLLPKAAAAFGEGLASRWKLLDKTKLGEATSEKLALSADAEASRCGQAMRVFETAEQALLSCAFGVEACDEAKLGATVQKLEQARRDADVAWPKVVLALASLPKEQRTGAERAAELGGCKEPWW